MSKLSSEKVDILRDIFSHNTDETFLIDALSGKKFSYGELEDASLKLGSFLRAQGVAKGDRIAFLLPNSIECSILYFACMHIGAIIVPVNHRLQAKEILTILEEASPKVLVTTSFLYKEKCHEAKLFSTINSITISLRFTADAQALQHSDPGSIDLWEKIHEYSSVATRSFEAIHDADIIAIVYTSGTTSRPKGVPIALGKMVHNALTFINVCHIPIGIRFLGTFSQGYLGGLYNTLFFQFVAQGSVVIDAGFTTDVALRFWETVEKFEVTALWLVPSMLSIILSIDRGVVGEKYASHHLKFVFVGTAPLISTLKKKFEKRYGIVLYENYGLSETLFITTNAPSFSKNKGVGQVIPGCHVTILDDKGRPCPPGTPGEVALLSEYMTSGYFNNPSETKKAFRKGTFYTGDMGYFDSDQHLLITDRKKDIIIRGGINISPKEIEEIIADVQGVREVAVTGIPHAISGEEIIAVIVGENVDIEMIKKVCIEHLAPFKVPSKIYVMPTLPKSATGKVQKQKLRQLIINLPI